MDPTQAARKPTHAPKTLAVTSPDFEDARGMPPEFTRDGANLHPALRFGNIPEGTKSIAILLEDVDAKGSPGGIFVHWAVWNLPPERPEIQRNQDVTDLGAVEGTNDKGNVGYDGPAPPEGFSHRYEFKVFALDTRLDELPRGAKAKELRRAMEGHVLAWGEIAPRYARPG